MNTTQQSVPTLEDRIMAALAHGVVILSLWGFVISAVLWATQRERQTYLRFQALQAMVYQICYMVIQVLMGLLLGVCASCLFPIMTFSAFSSPRVEGPTSTPSQHFAEPFIPIWVCLMIPYTLIWLGLVAYGFYGAFQAYRGQDFRYAIIGERLERYLARSQSVEV